MTTNNNTVLASDLLNLATTAAGTNGIALTIDSGMTAQVVNDLPSVAAVPAAAAGQVSVKVNGNNVQVDYVDGMTVDSLRSALGAQLEMNLSNYDFSIYGGNDVATEVQGNDVVKPGQSFLAAPASASLG